MKTRRSSWLLVLALITQLLSPAVGALTISDNGVWSVSCAGKPQWLPLQGEKHTPQGHTGDCTLCCDEPRSHTGAICGPHPVLHHQAPGIGHYPTGEATVIQRIISHPTRAPPADQ